MASSRVPRVSRPVPGTSGRILSILEIGQCPVGMRRGVHPGGDGGRGQAGRGAGQQGGPGPAAEMIAPVMMLPTGVVPM
jgi:hypothetical protein